MKKKQLTLLLAGAILTSNLALTSTYANAVEQSNNNQIESNSGSNANVPTVEFQKVYFDRNDPKEVEITGIDFKNENLKYLSINKNEIDINNVTIGKNSIKIPANILYDLDFPTDLYHIAIGFTDNTLYSGVATIQYTSDKEITPPPSNPDDSNNQGTVKPPRKPSIDVKSVTYDIAKPDNVVINNVNFDDDSLKRIYINNSVLEKGDFTTTTDSIVILKQGLEKAKLVKGNYSMSFAFESGATLQSQVELEVLNSAPAETTTPVKPPSNTVKPPVNENPVQPPVIVDPSLANRNPKVDYQELNYNLAKPSAITIDNVTFDGTQLSYMYINNKLIDASEVDKNDNSITIPKSVLSKLGIVPGNYSISFAFNNNKTLIDAAYLIVTNTPSTPAEGNTSTNFTFDTSKDTSLTLSNIIPAGSSVDSIVINGKEVAVKYPELRLLSLHEDTSFEPYVFVDGENVIIPKETLLYLKLDDSNYDVDVTLDDGTVVSKNISVNVIDSSHDNNVNVPDSSEDSNVTITNPAEATTESNNTNTSTSENTENNTSSVSNTTEVKSKSKSSSKSPKTGDVAGIGLLATLITSIGGIIGFKKK